MEACILTCLNSTIAAAGSSGAISQSTTNALLSLETIVPVVVGAAVLLHQQYTHWSLSSKLPAAAAAPVAVPAPVPAAVHPAEAAH